MRASATAHLLTVFWALLAGAALLWPDPVPTSVNEIPEWISGAVHLFLFLFMTIFLVRSLELARWAHPRLSGFFLAFAYGLVLEGLQLAVEARAAGWQDVAMNGLGGAIGFALLTASRARSDRAPSRDTD